MVDNETDTLSSIDPGLPQLPEVATHLQRVPPVEQADGTPSIQVFDHLCVACHGLSVLARARRGGQNHTVLFDVGPYGDVWLANVDRLGVDLAAIDTVFLSHWHWDHSGGLPVAVAAIAEARAAAGRPAPIVDLHPDRPDQRGVRTGDGPLVLLPPEPTLAGIIAAGGVVELHAEPHVLGDDLFLGSGTIARTTSYETGLVGHHTLRDGVATPDPLILDERFLAARVAGRGVTVLSACSHAGVVNACLAATAHYPGPPWTWSSAATTWPARPWNPGSVRPSRTWPSASTPPSWRPATAPGGEPRPPWPTASPGRYAPSVVGSTYVLTASEGARASSPEVNRPHAQPA